MGIEAISGLNLQAPVIDAAAKVLADNIGSMVYAAGSVRQAY